MKNAVRILIVILAIIFSAGAWAVRDIPDSADVIVDGITINWFPEGKPGAADPSEKIYVWMVWREVDASGNPTIGPLQAEVKYSNLSGTLQAAVKLLLQRGYKYGRTEIGEDDQPMPGLPE